MKSRKNNLRFFDKRAAEHREEEKFDNFLDTMIQEHDSYSEQDLD